MRPVAEKTAIQENLAQLRLNSFRIMLLLTTIVGWVWFSWSIWPEDQPTLFRSDAWMVSIALLFVVVLSFMTSWSMVVSTNIFVCGLIGVITGSIILFESAEISYLYVIPLIFSSVLLSQLELILIAGVIGALILMIHVSVPGLQSSDFFTPITTISLTTIAILISNNNLTTALAWTLNGYQEAHKNELIARERKARLERVLKSLDTTMSKLQRANVMLVQARNRAEEARKLKQQFAQTISHELRTPLNLVVGFTETMIKSPEYYGGPLSPPYLRDLSVVYRNACHLQNLVNDVLDLARLESAYMSLESEELNIADVINDAASTARGLVEGRGLALQTEIEPHLPPVWGDAVRLKQVLLNLLNNAARFTERGNITVKAVAQNGEVVVSVSDTGIGIPEEKISDIFESFRQLENPMQRRNEGAGLGLAISKQLIHLHGGRIWVNSEVGVGSHFYFSLPVAHVETLNTDKPLEIGISKESAAVRDEQQIVLIVTRSPSAAALLSRFLPDYRPIVVPNLNQASAAAEQVMPQVLIIDTETETIEQTDLNSFAETLNLPRTLIIACPFPGEEPLRQRLVVDAYLIKPISYDNLWDVLRQFSANLNNVLVVDHDPDFARLIGRMLANPVRQYQVSYAYSGHEALGMIRHTKPDILLLDLNLPDIDDQNVIQQIRSDPKLRDIHIVIITAYEEMDLTNLLNGTIYITKTSGLVPNEIVNWISAIMQSTAQGMPVTLPLLDTEVIPGVWHKMPTARVP